MSISNEKEKPLIIRYLVKHPLSTVRDIAKNYSSKQRRQETITNILKELEKTEKIGSLGRSKPLYYYVTPPFERILSTLLAIIDSNKIFLPRIKSMEYKEIHVENKIRFSDIVNNFVSLYHLQLKILLFEKKLYIKLTKKNILRNPYTARFHRLFVEFWEKTVVEPDESYDGLLSLLEFGISEEHFVESEYFSRLKSNKFAFKKKIRLMDAYLDDPGEAVANYRPKKYKYTKKDEITGEIKKTNRNRVEPKYVRSRLRSLMDETREFSWKKAMVRQEMRDGMFFRQVFRLGHVPSEDYWADLGAGGDKVDSAIFKLAIKHARKEASKINPRKRKLIEKALDEKAKLEDPRIFDLYDISRLFSF